MELHHRAQSVKLILRLPYVAPPDDDSADTANFRMAR
jgi:hypothetical protein